MKTYSGKNPKFPGIYLLIILVILALLVGGCKSKKKLVEKKQETVSVLEQKDIKASEKIKADVSIISVKKNQHIKISPVDAHNSSKVIYKGDTLSFLNAKIEIEDSNSSESSQDKTITEGYSSDQSHTNSQTATKEKTVFKEKKGTHPLFIWGGLLLLLILILLLIARFYFKKKLPFL